MTIRKPKVTTIFICLALFIFFLIISFPFQNLKGYLFNQIHKNTGILILADEIYLSFFGWPGIGMKNVSATLPMGRDELDISCNKMVFRIGLGSFFPPNPSVSVHIIDLKKGGDIFVKLIQSNERFRAWLEADEVNLGQFDFPGMTDAITGSLNAKGQVDWLQKQIPNSKGYLEIDIDKFHSPSQNIQGFVLPNLDIGEINGLVRILNGSIVTNRFQVGSSKSGFQGTINGELKLAQDFLQSFLNLTLKIQLSQDYRAQPESATLVSFLSTYEISPGDYGLSWRSTLHGMTTNLMNAIPQKARD